MALIDCPECQNHISDAAPACPHCGLPRKHTSSRSLFGKFLAVTFIVFNLCAFFALLVAADYGLIDMSTKKALMALTAIFDDAVNTFTFLVSWLTGAVLLGMLVLFTRPK